MNASITAQALFDQRQDRMEPHGAAWGPRRVPGPEVPAATVSVVSGRNLTVLAEAAARTRILRAKGLDPAVAFLAAHPHFPEEGAP